MRCLWTFSSLVRASCVVSDVWATDRDFDRPRRDDGTHRYTTWVKKRTLQFLLLRRRRRPLALSCGVGEVFTRLSVCHHNFPRLYVVNFCVSFPPPCRQRRHRVQQGTSNLAKSTRYQGSRESRYPSKARPNRAEIARKGSRRWRQRRCKTPEAWCHQ